MYLMVANSCNSASKLNHDSIFGFLDFQTYLLIGMIFTHLLARLKVRKTSASFFISLITPKLKIIVYGIFYLPCLKYKQTFDTNICPGYLKSSANYPYKTSLAPTATDWPISL